MGRTTPSLWSSVSEYVERMRKISEMLPTEEREFMEYLLEDVESTISLCMHTGVVDPLEVLLIHFARRIGRQDCRTD